MFFHYQICSDTTFHICLNFGLKLPSYTSILIFHSANGSVDPSEPPYTYTYCLHFPLKECVHEYITEGAQCIRLYANNYYLTYGHTKCFFQRKPMEIPAHTHHMKHEMPLTRFHFYIAVLYVKSFTILLYLQTTLTTHT